jgi:hypothetical protein
MNNALAFASSLVLLAACGDSDPPAGADAAHDFDAIVPLPDSAFDGPPQPTVVSVVIDHEPGAVVHAIYQDGNGPWLLATDEGGGGYSFPNTTGRYGYGYTCADAVWQEGVFSFATVGETPTQMYASCGFVVTASTTHTVSGHISGLTGGGYRARIGTLSTSSTTAGAGANYSVDPSEDTSTALFYGRFSDAQRAHVDRLVIRRDVEITADLVENVAFATQGADTVSQPITVAGATTDESVYVSARFRVLDGSFFGIQLTGDITDPYTIEFPATADWNVGDRHTLTVDSFGDTPDFREITRGFVAAADVPATLALTLPPALAGAGFTATTSGPGPVFRAGSEADPLADGYQMYAYSQVGITNPSCDASTCYPYFFLDVTPAWIGAATNVSITTPDPAELDALGAWDDRLAIPTGNTAAYYYAATHVIDDYTYTAGQSGELNL